MGSTWAFVVYLVYFEFVLFFCVVSMIKHSTIVYVLSALVLLFTIFEVIEIMQKNPTTCEIKEDIDMNDHICVKKQNDVLLCCNNNPIGFFDFAKAIIGLMGAISGCVLARNDAMLEDSIV